MSLADRCIHEFESGVRNRGEQYFREGRVTPGERGPSEFRASVRGESEYEVVLDWEFSREQLAVCCTCPYYDEHATCKHIWATILTADKAGIGPRGKSRLGILPMEPEDYDEDEDDRSWIDLVRRRRRRGRGDDLPAGPRKAAKGGPAASLRVAENRRSPSGSSNLLGPRRMSSRRIPSRKSYVLCRRPAKSGM